MNTFPVRNGVLIKEVPWAMLQNHALKLVGRGSVDWYKYNGGLPAAMILEVLHGAPPNSTPATQSTDIHERLLIEQVRAWEGRQVKTTTKVTPMTYEQQHAIMEAQRNDSAAQLTGHLTSTREVAIYEAGFSNGWYRCKKEHNLLASHEATIDLAPDNQKALRERSVVFGNMKTQLENTQRELADLKASKSTRLSPDMLARIVLAVTEAVDNDDSLSPSWNQAEAIGSAVQVAIFGKSSS